MLVPDPAVLTQADVLKRGGFVGKTSVLVVPCTDKRLVVPLLWERSCCIIIAGVRIQEGKKHGKNY